MFEINGEFGKLFESTKKLSERFRSVNESTRARVGIELDDGTIQSIYLHHGHPNDIKQILAQHYTDEIKILELIHLGDISSLGPEIGTKHDFDERPEGQVNAYGRDRGESGIESKFSESEEDFENLARETDGEYSYLFQDGQWVVTNLWKPEKLAYPETMRQTYPKEEEGYNESNEEEI